LIPRHLAEPLRVAAARYPVVTLTGPRQSGKTTLARAVFPDHSYVSLELPDERDFALTDPRGFLGRFTRPVILDEVQRTPDLFSYIQVLVDEEDLPGRFILTGSQNFLLLDKVSQSLAGRSAIHHLLPLSIGELARRPHPGLDDLGEPLPPRPPSTSPPGEPPPKDLEATLFGGFYPRIHDKALPPRDWLANYHQTYLERDVRQVLQVGDLEAFARFVGLCAGRNAQVLNVSGLASDAGVSHTTARRWLSVLETSFVITLLRPYHRNFGKRLIKSPKLYFLDTGLLCYLLGVRAPEELHVHASRGAIFESLVVSEICKRFHHHGERPALWFWRDAAGHEVDAVVDLGARTITVEAKSARTVVDGFFKGLSRWRELAGDAAISSVVVYGGDDARVQRGVIVRPWWTL